MRMTKIGSVPAFIKATVRCCGAAPAGSKTGTAKAGPNKRKQKAVLQQNGSINYNSS